MRLFALPALLVGVALAAFSATPASALPAIHHSAYADSVVSYNPGGAGPSFNHRGTFNALGAPDYDGKDRCGSQAGCSFVSLGQGGSITLKFTDNKLTGSGNSDFDLWIFEVGANVERTFVEISKDGLTWFDVGFVGGSTSGIDIDAFGFGVGDLFAFVRLTDDPNQGSGRGKTPGADIDAVAALSTVLTPMEVTPIAEPGTFALLGMGLAWLGARSRRKAVWRRAT